MRSCVGILALIAFFFSSSMYVAQLLIQRCRTLSSS